MAFRSKRTKRDPQAVELMNSLLDEVDEERARRVRHQLGQRRWLVSWSQIDGGKWLARLSGPGRPETIERSGRTRVHAIELAVAAAGLSLPKPRPIF
jgi:hypothetical protein